MESNTDSGSVGSAPPEGQPSGGDGQNVQPSSTENQVDVSALLNRLDEMGQQVKALQSDKDKAAYRAERIGEDNTKEISRIRELISAGKSDAEVERELLVDQLVQRQNADVPGTTQTQPVTTSNVTGGEQPDVSAVVSALGLDINDASVQNIMWQSGGNMTKLQNDLMNHKIRVQSTAGVQPPAAAAPPAEAGPPPSQANNIDELTERLQQAQLSGNKEERKRIRKLLDESGAYGPVGS